MKKKAKFSPRTELTFPNGPTVKADVTKTGLLAVHKPLSESGKGYVVTHVPSLRVVLWKKLKRDAVDAQKSLEAMDWREGAGLGDIREKIRSLRVPAS